MTRTIFVIKTKRSDNCTRLYDNIVSNANVIVNCYVGHNYTSRADTHIFTYNCRRVNPSCFANSLTFTIRLIEKTEGIKVIQNFIKTAKRIITNDDSFAFWYFYFFVDENYRCSRIQCFIVVLWMINKYNITFFNSVNFIYSTNRKFSISKKRRFKNFSYFAKAIRFTK